MPTIIHAQVVLPHRNAIPRDAAINTFTFGLPGGTGTDEDAATDAAAIQPAIEDFYNDVKGSGFKVASFISPDRSRSADAATVRYYNISAHLNGSAAGPPVAVIPWSLGTSAGGDALPAECSVVLSFHGDDTSIPEFGPGTRPRARHRGRIFVGPVNINSLEADAQFEARVAEECQTTIAEAATDLAANGVMFWEVWSRANAAVYDVVGGWVDDAFDTQRRRGPDPTARLIWPPPV